MKKRGCPLSFIVPSQSGFQTANFGISKNPTQRTVPKANGIVTDFGIFLRGSFFDFHPNQVRVFKLEDFSADEGPELNGGVLVGVLEPHFYNLLFFDVLIIH
jgi:hypothetical protein